MMRRLAPQMRWRLGCALVAAVVAAAAAVRGEDPIESARARVRSQQKRAERVVRALLDAQLLRLESNGLSDEPVYADIREMRQQIADGVQPELARLGSRLAEAAQLPEGSPRRAEIARTAAAGLRALVGTWLEQRAALRRRMQALALARDAQEILQLVSKAKEEWPRTTADAALADQRLSDIGVLSEAWRRQAERAQGAAADPIPGAGRALAALQHGDLDGLLEAALLDVRRGEVARTRSRVAQLERLWAEVARRLENASETTNVGAPAEPGPDSSAAELAEEAEQLDSLERSLRASTRWTAAGFREWLLGWPNANDYSPGRYVQAARETTAKRLAAGAANRELAALIRGVSGRLNTRRRDARRESLGVGVGELARAAEVAERMAARARTIGSATGELADTARWLGMGVRDLAPEASAELVAASARLDVTSGESGGATEQLLSTAEQLRRRQVALAESLIAVTLEQIAELDPAIVAVSKLRSQIGPPLDQEFAKVELELLEAWRAQLEANGDSLAADVDRWRAAMTHLRLLSQRIANIDAAELDFAEVAALHQAHEISLRRNWTARRWRIAGLLDQWRSMRQYQLRGDLKALAESRAGFERAASRLIRQPIALANLVDPGAGADRSGSQLRATRALRRARTLGGGDRWKIRDREVAESVEDHRRRWLTLARAGDALTNRPPETPPREAANDLRRAVAQALHDWRRLAQERTAALAEAVLAAGATFEAIRDVASRLDFAGLAPLDAVGDAAAPGPFGMALARCEAALQQRRNLMRRDLDAARAMVKVVEQQAGQRAAIDEARQQLDAAGKQLASDRAREAAKRLEDSVRGFSESQTEIGRLAVEISGQSEVANRELREALRRASQWNKPGVEKSSGAAGAEAASAGSSPSSDAAAGDPRAFPNDAAQASGPAPDAQPLGEQLVPASPESTARQIAGGQALEQAESALSAGSAQGDAPPEGDSQGSPSGAGADSGAAPQNQATAAESGARAEGSGAQGPDADLEASDSKRGLWTLAPERSQAGYGVQSRRPAPAGYRTRMRRYFQSPSNRTSPPVDRR